MSTENLLANLFQQLDDHIKRIVDTRVAEIMQAQATLAFIDEKLEERIKEVCAGVSEDIIDEAIARHERDAEHIDADTITDTAIEAVNDYDFDDRIAQALRDSDTPDESRVEEMIAEALSDFDVQERVEVALASDDVWGAGSKFESLVKKVMQNTEFSVSIN
jgi:hypothetical protein